MVVISSIDPTVIYTDSKKLDENDVEFETNSIYEYDFDGMPIEFVLGNVNDKKQLRFYYIYILINNVVKSKIGIYEIKLTDCIKDLNDDDDNCINLENGNIIFIVNKDYIEKLMGTNVIEVIEDPTDEVTGEPTEELIEEPTEELIEEPNEDITEEPSDFVATGENPLWKENPQYIERYELPEETTINKDYIDSENNKWIQTFMENNNYDIINCGEMNDCLFQIIHTAFERIGRIITIEQLRQIVADNITDEIFNGYKDKYTFISQQIQIIDNELKIKKNNSNVLKTICEKSNNSIYIKQAKDNAMEHNNLIKTKKIINQALIEMSPFMKGVSSLEEFKGKIKTPQFYPDITATQILERVLNIKFILLSEQSYKDGDFNSVLLCGNTNNNDDIYNPEYYIMISNIDKRYNLITYFKRPILLFKEIPYVIKTLLIQKCMEKNAGSYYLIKDFHKFQKSKGINPDIGEPILLDDYEKHNYELFDINIVFSFHENSYNHFLPGMGDGEHIDYNILFDSQNDYINLYTSKNWRRMLDDSWSSQFMVDGMKWTSVEHYMLGSQFKKGFPDYYKMFSINSGSPISTNVKKARDAGNITKIKKDGKPYTIDNDFYDVSSPRKNEERETALYSKYEQNLDLRDVLLKTKNAFLCKYHKKKPREPDMMLMKTRKLFITGGGIPK